MDQICDSVDSIKYAKAHVEECLASGEFQGKCWHSDKKLSTVKCLKGRAKGNKTVNIAIE